MPTLLNSAIRLRPICTLDSTVLTNLGFSFDGYYWTKDHFPMKLVKGENGKYLVEPDPSLNLTEAIPPIGRNDQLIELMIPAFLQLVQARLNYLRTDNLKSFKSITDGLVESFFNPNESGFRVEVVIVPRKQLDSTTNKLVDVPTIEVRPVDASSYTILSQVQCRFKVQYSDSEQTYIEFEVIVNPNCMSYRFLQQFITEGQTIDQVLVECQDEDGDLHYEPFFGTGIFAK